MTTRVRPTTGYARDPEPPSHLPALLTGVVIGAATWALLYLVASFVGWPTVIVGMFLLTLAVIYLLATAPEGAEA